MKLDIKKYLFVILFCLFLYVRTSFAQKPNILLFFVDDMGYSELGCYNGNTDLLTPNIDGLAENGVRCTAGYVSAPQCSPSRACLLTGQYQQRFGHEANPEGEPDRWKFGLNRGMRTIGDRMRSAGYKTGAIGKWDLGRKSEDHPVNRGFDFYYGSLIGARHYWPTDNGQAHIQVSRTPDQLVTETLYHTYQLTKGAAEFIDTYQKEPFFLYVAYTAPHWPFEATEADIARNNHIEEKERRTYAGMITALDNCVGRIVNKLKEYDLEENTLIFFISDNGAPGYDATKDNNLPLRGHKGDLFEGGIRVPFIVQWKTSDLTPGSTYERPVSSLDVLPTVLNAAGAENPEFVPGVNILPYLAGKRANQTPVDVLYWRWMGQRAVRSGDWKWVSHPKENVVGLFNLAKDISEENNLIDVYPDKANALETLWREWNLDNVEPLWRKPEQLKFMREQYGNQGMHPLIQ